MCFLCNWDSLYVIDNQLNFHSEGLFNHWEKIISSWVLVLTVRKLVLRMHYSCVCVCVCVCLCTAVFVGTSTGFDHTLWGQKALWGQKNMSRNVFFNFKHENASEGWFMTSSEFDVFWPHKVCMCIKIHFLWGHCKHILNSIFLSYGDNFLVCVSPGDIVIIHYNKNINNLTFKFYQKIIVR